MKYLKTALLAAGIAAMASQAQAQVTVVPENDKGFSLSLIGRTNIDAGTYFEDHDMKNADGEVETRTFNGVMVNDTRLGVKGKFTDNWEYKIEICFANKAISFRDVYVKYNINKSNHFQIGNFFMPFGMKQLGLAYKFEEDATVDYAFCPSRKIGAAYLFNNDRFNLVGGIFSDGNVDNSNKFADKNNNVDAGLNLAAKGIVRPVVNDESNVILHFGVGALYTNSKNPGSFSGITPNTFAPKTVISQKFDAPSYSRMEAEMIFIAKKFMLETHFQQAGADERGKSDRTTVNGILAQASYLLIGEKQNYNKATGLCQNASKGNLEFLVRYDHLDFDKDVNGVQNDFTVGLNYFVNKHFNVKLNYVNVSVDKKGIKENFNSIQTRLQFSF